MLLAASAALVAAQAADGSPRPPLPGSVAALVMAAFGALAVCLTMLHTAQSAAVDRADEDREDDATFPMPTASPRLEHRTCWFAALGFQVAFDVLLAARIIPLFPGAPLVGASLAGLAVLAVHAVLFEMIARTWGLTCARFLMRRVEPAVARILRPLGALLAPSAPASRGDERELELLPYVRGVDRLVVEEAVEMIDSVRRFAELTARDIMTPRTDIEGLSSRTPRDEVFRRLVEAEYSRQVVFDGTFDNIAGFLMAKEVLLNRPEDPFSMLHRPIVVSSEMHLPELLRRIRQSRSNFAVVEDEYGGTAGIVTLHDLFESVIGEDIADEHEPDEPWIQWSVDGTATLSGRAEVWDVNEELDLELDEDIARTLGGYLMHRLGRVPAAGEAWTVDRGEFRVLEVVNNRIERIAFRRVAGASEARSPSPQEAAP